ncbi:MAG: pteridine reductase [Phycisphaerales bacterium]|nr:pteridine reductase [Phycisphaerales bacterium]
MHRPSKVALITGAAKRVGRAIALQLAHEGFDIAFTYLSSQGEAQSLLTEITTQGRRAHAIRADLAQPEIATEEIHRAVTVEFGQLDVLVNNASLYLQADLQSTTSAIIHRLNAIHVESPLLLCQRFEPMLRAARGHVINMVDLLAERPWPQFLPYCASKAALANLTLGLARALAPEVTVNGIAPGVVEWPPDYPQGEREKYLKRVPLGRTGTPQDVASLIKFLVTEGSYITGQILRLDGGRSIT